MREAHKAPAIVAFTSPFRLVLRDRDDTWSPTLDDINNQTYDYVKLHRLSTSLDIGLPSPFCMHVAFDGSLLLPKVEQFWPIEKAVLAFNKILGFILIGGVYFGPVDPTDIDQAVLYTTGYFRSFGIASGFTGRIRMALQTKVAGPLYSILLHEPKHIFAVDIHQAYRKGKAICSSIPTLSPDFLVRGVSAFVSHDWGACLSHVWITVEQVTEFLWTQNVVDEAIQLTPNILGRRDFLRDYRTWTTSSRLEVLFQRGILSAATYQLVTVARKARNDLVHSGKFPDRTSAEAALDGVFQLIAHVTSPDKIEYFAESLNVYKSLDPIERHYMRREAVPVDQVDALWLGPLPPIPGEPQWGDRPFESVVDSPKGNSR